MALINVVGLSESLLNELIPRLKSFADRGKTSSFKPVFPAVTCSAQSTYLTGTSPAEHGIVANGWYDRESAEVKFWKQSNHLVKGDKIWDVLREEFPEFTCAKLFWWYNMYSTADYTITPRPMYPADGRKVFDIYTQPMGMREEIKADLGDFPFLSFWGPKAGLPSSEWIAQSAKWVEEKYQPTLNLIYLPHLDYGLQKWGSDDHRMVKELNGIDRIAGDLIEFFEQRGVRVMLLSEYGISKVDTPIALNRLFRRQGWITIKKEMGLELLDCGASQVFAVADHQVAHVYIADKTQLVKVRKFLEGVDGVAKVMEAKEVWGEGLGTSRAGDLVVLSNSNAWFSYYYWEEDKLAPDFARTVDIHRKPGYDPVELFMNPQLKFPLAKVAKFLLKKKLGLRALLEVIPLDDHLINGSHGSHQVPKNEWPVFIDGEGIFSVDQAESIFDIVRMAIKGEG